MTISGITSTGFQQFSLNDQPYIDLVGYSHVRMRVIDGAGTAGTTTTYTASFYAEGDDCDWSFPAPESFGLLSMGRKLGYVRLQQAVVDGNNKTLTGQVCDVYGNPISGAKTVRVVLGDTAKAGAEDLATNATISAISQGTIVFGSGTNKAVVTTNSAGTFALNVLDASAENVYASVDSVGIPQTGGFLVCGSDQETMTFS